MNERLALPANLQRASDPGAPRSLRAQVVVVGLGAGGSMALHDLARAGVDVIGLETGPWLPTAAMTGREEQMMPVLFAEGAARATMDMGVQILQGRGVGGSTLHNTNLCKRLPPAILDAWERDDPSLGRALRQGLDEDFASVERLLNVHPVPDVRVNANNDVLAAGTRALGYDGGRLAHNRDDDCRGSGLCELGCPNGGKVNGAKALVPPALAAGARVLTEARAHRLLLDRRGRVRGVEGRAFDLSTGRDLHGFTVHAEHVVLAGSATGSAALCLRSGLPDPHGLTGANLRMHPGGYCVGIFDGPEQPPVRGWLGVPQSEECTEFLRFDDEARRVWLVAGFAHPGAAAGLLGGFGRAHGELMRLYPRIAVGIAMVHDYSRGRVSPGPGEQIHVRYEMNGDDRAQLALGLRELGNIYLAAGARRVLIPTRRPFFARCASELDGLRAEDLGPLDPPLVAVHPMGTLAMGSTPERGVVDAHGAHHHVPGLSVADSSLFPTSIGGPPQITIYTLARRVARAVIANL